MRISTHSPCTVLVSLPVQDTPLKTGDVATVVEYYPVAGGEDGTHRNLFTIGGLFIMMTHEPECVTLKRRGAEYVADKIQMNATTIYIKRRTFI